MKVLLTLFVFFSINIPTLQIEDIDLSTEQNEQRNMKANHETTSIIIEVKGNPEQHKTYINQHFPTVEVVETYDILFLGLALKGPAHKIEQATKLEFIKAIYPVQKYETMSLPKNDLAKTGNVVFPEQLNNTPYTGKGVDVAVIDTGVDYTHPDLVDNFIKGKDVVDLDDDPMETTPEEGIPTTHGTHVAGIIAANGSLKGVAPEANIYAYRALGPGGFGTSIQVLAALEEAVKDEVDIINLSLGNSVNGPDYPTSLAVNEATKHGIAVVIANGNSGPKEWTVGAPATATTALSVGAYDQSRQVPYLYDAKKDKKIALTPLMISEPWSLKRDYEIVTNINDKLPQGNISLISLDENAIEDIATIEQAGGEAILIYESEKMDIESFIGLIEEPIKIPVAFISKENGKWLDQRIKEETVYFKSELQTKKETIAPFSSRGPVTVNWMLKPDIVAPGVNIISTVPGGYEVLNGTSMAAPHVTGAIALIKEAQPTWTNEQIFGALRTTAKKIRTSDAESSMIQGTGLIQVNDAIETETIIDNPLLSFGKVHKHVSERTIKLTIENMSQSTQTYSFDIPKKKQGLTWYLPKSFTLNPNEIMTIPITLKINSLQLKEGIHEGWLSLNRGDGKKYSLPYMFINETANYPHVMGFSFHLNPNDDTYYNYQLYVAEEVRSVQVQLYNPDTFIYESTLGPWTDLEIGMNEGQIKRKNITQKGQFYGLIVVQLENGEYVSYETDIFIM